MQEMLEAEMTQHLGYDPYEHSESTNARNGRKRKTILSKYGDTEIKVPQDKEGTFKPQIVKKRQKDISDIEDKIISMYAIGKGIMILFMEQKLFL
nr:transposase [uncultured Fusobacterium sp.]